MSLRQQAAAYARAFLEDSASGFGWPVTVTDPDGNTGELTGYWNDISHSIDPQTGLLVSGRTASVVLSLASLTAAGLGAPHAIADGAKRPWLIEVADLTGNPQTFKVREANPDNALGIIVCVLEGYRK